MRRKRSSNQRMPFFRELRTKPVESTNGSKDRHPFFQLTTFEGQAIDIVDGKILEVLNAKSSKYPSIDPDDQSTWVRTGKERDYLTFISEHYDLE